MNDLQDQCRQRTYRVFVSEEQGVFCSLHVCSWGVCAVEDHFGQFVLVFGLPRHTVVNETTVGRPKNGKSAEREHCDQLVWTCTKLPFEITQPSGDSLIRGPLNQHSGWTGHQTISCSSPLFVLLLVKDLFSLGVFRAPVRSKILKCFKLICIWMCFF